MKKNKKLFNSILSGLMLVLSFPPFPFFFLVFIAFVPLLQVLENIPKRRYIYIYITFFIYHLGSNWWIGSWQEDTDIYLTLSSIVLNFVHPFFFMIPFAFFFIYTKRYSSNTAALLFPFCWILFEWFHNLGEFSYPWLTVGNTQIYNFYWVQIIDITGIWGASFLIMIFNILIYKLFCRYTNLAGFKIFIKDRKNSLIIAILVSIIVLPIIYGLIRINDFDHEKMMKENKKVSVGIVQPSINPWRKWEINTNGMIKLHFQIIDSLLKEGKKPDVVIWNETAVPSYINVDNEFDYYILKNWVDKHQISLFTGFAESRYFSEEDRTPTSRKLNEKGNVYFEPYNSSILINPIENSKPQTYAKMRLTPMAERLPYSEYLMFMRSWFQWETGISSWGIGEKQQNLIIRNNNKEISLGPIICIESIYPEFVSNISKNGAEFLVIITNDAWYDYTPGPYQHYVIAQMRAIENRRYIARSANTGVSGIISPVGKNIELLPQYTKSALYGEIPCIKETTFYAEYGDWVGYLSLIIVFISTLFAYTKKYLNF